MDYNQAIQLISDLEDKYLMVAVVISAIIGMALNYFGLRLYNLAVFLVGTMVGLVVGGLMAFSAESEIEKLFIITIIALGCGSLAVFLSDFISIIAGAFICTILGVSIGGNEPFVIIISIIIGGYLGYLLFNMFAILSTVSVGSTSLLYSYINVSSFFNENTSSWTFSTFNSYIGKLIVEAYNNGSLSVIWETAAHDLIVLSIFAITGFYFQMSYLLRSDMNRQKQEDESEE